MDYYTEQMISTPIDKLVPEIKQFILLDIDEQEILTAFKNDNSIHQKILSKFTKLAERVEFIEALGVLGKEIGRRHNYTVHDKRTGNTIHRTVDFECQWLEHDFAGAHKDIESHQIYLLISCIDLIMGQEPYLDPFEWLEDRLNNGISNEELTLLHDEYYEDFGLSKLFISAFVDHLDDEVEYLWLNSFFCAAINKKDNETPATINNESLDFWRARSDRDKLKKIAQILYEKRSSFTHRSIRSFLCDLPIANCSVTRKNSLISYGRIDLISLLLKTVRSLATNLLWRELKCGIK